MQPEDELTNQSSFQAKP